MSVLLRVIAPLIVCYDFIAVSTTNILNITQKQAIYSQTRRILNGHEAGDTRPYMVYLKPVQSHTHLVESHWTCGGVIIHEQYILTSAACIEDAEHFFVVSGTHKWVPANETDNECVKNGEMKAVWKCVPKTYIFDAANFENHKWMINDIAVVKVDGNFNFNRKIKGCDFVPQKIQYNNISMDHEMPDTVGSLTGWGSTSDFADPDASTAPDYNSPELLETETQIINDISCKREWPQGYHHIIDESMICARDNAEADMSDICKDQVKCDPLVYHKRGRRIGIDPKTLTVHTAHHVFEDTGRRNGVFGGFCQNDHGGPFVVGHGKSAIVVGVMSACQTRAITHRCHGPFLFTSVFRNRNLISCAIDKDIAVSCANYFRSSRPTMIQTKFDWSIFLRAATVSIGTPEIKRKHMVVPEIHEYPTQPSFPAEIFNTSTTIWRTSIATEATVTAEAKLTTEAKVTTEAKLTTEAKITREAKITTEAKLTKEATVTTEATGTTDPYEYNFTQ